MNKQYLLNNPSIAFLAQQHIWSVRSGHQIMVTAGMGLDEQVVSFPDDLDELQNTILALRHSDYKTWRGFDVRHIIKQNGTEYRQFDVFSALDNASAHLDQGAIDFITMRDRDAQLELMLHPDHYSEANLGKWFGDMDESEIRLAMAFRNQMVQDASPLRHNIATGAYILKREPLPRIDQLVIYDEMRLVITPQGMAVSIIKDNYYVPFWWSPERDTNTLRVWSPVEIVIAVDIMLAAIWRDACIVHSAAFPSRKSLGRGYKAKSKHKSFVIRLPRTLYKSTWGTPEDRETVETIVRTAHAVRGHYRVLSEGAIASDEAIMNAQRLGYPTPPQGYTFVQPHRRGEGEIKAKPVICKGLQIAKTILS